VIIDASATTRSSPCLLRCPTLRILPGKPIPGELPEVLARILLLLMLLPVLEIAVLVWLADLTSWLVVLGVLVGAGVLGAFLARQQGVRSLGRLSRELGGGQLPADAMFDAVLVSFAGVLLILPGLLSDVMAILLLLPPTRRLFKSAIRRRFQGQVSASSFSTFDESRPRDQIIDVKVLDSPPQEQQ
jgi:UPF0716 protein FxsA